MAEPGATKVRMRVSEPQETPLPPPVCLRLERAVLVGLRCDADINKKVSDAIPVS